ncbi:MAG: glutathione S-transferase family protein [Bacillota bacterium]
MNTTSMTLYYSPGACSLAPHILLEETGADYRLVEVSVAKGQTQEEAFLKINPKGRVPVLAIGSRTLTEVPAICWYIGAAGKGLIPADALLRAGVLEWFNWLSGTLHAVAFGGKWRPQRFVKDTALFGDVQARADDNLRDGFAYIEARMVERQWAVGDEYSVVDPYLFVFYNWARKIGVDVAQAYPAWHAHARRIAARDAVRRACDREGLR